MTGPYFIGIDGGTQSTKVTVFDAKGSIVCSARAPLKPIVQETGGIAYHPEDDLWASLGQACREAMQAFPVSPDEIQAIGLCSIRCCRVLLDSKGELVEPVISWMDTRLSKPYQHQNIQVDKVTATSGYLAFRLTGDMIDSAANYEGQWPLDKANWQWSSVDSAYTATGLDRSQLFSLAMPSEIHGVVTKEAARHTGMPQGLPVVVTANDKAVEALGAGIHDSNQCLISLGTYIAAMQTGPHLNEGAQSYFSNLACIPNRYLYESAGIREGMRLVSWLCALSGKTEQELNSLAAQIPIASEGVIIHPTWLAAPDSPEKTGAILGLNARHGIGHLYRAMLEAITLSMWQNVHAMWNELSEKPECLVLTGGGSKSQVMVQMFADVFDLPCVLPRVADAAGLGAAMTAAVGVGYFADFDTAISTMVVEAKRAEPVRDNVKTYQSYRSDVYQKLDSDLENVFNTLYQYNRSLV